MKSIHALREVEMQSDVNTQEHFFKGLFHVFNDSNVNYVVLHSWQTLPKSATSDVDMLISADEKKRLPLLLKKVEDLTGWRFVQKLWYDVPWCFYYVAVSPDGKASAALDFVSDPKGVGEYRIKDAQILSNREFSGFLYHLSTEAELAYKLAKRLVKGIFREGDVDFVNEYFHRSTLAVLRERMAELLPVRVSEELLALIDGGCKLDELRDYMATHSPAFVLFGRRWRIKLGLSWFVNTIRRIVFRIVNPTGVIVYLKDCDAAENLKMPAFVFRRENTISASALSWRKKLTALSSATLLKVVGAEQEGFDIGRGFVPFEGGNMCSEIFRAMANKNVFGTIITKSDSGG